MIDLLAKQRYFFIGVAGAGMSAIAQYLAGNGKTVSGSDRLFLAESDDPVQKKLEEAHIQCFIQDGSGLDPQIDYVIVSTAIEETNPEIQKARLLNIPVVLRADLLAAICKSKRTIAIAGTSGKSSVTAMLYHILEQQGLGPSLISGAGLVDLQRKGKIGNAACGDGEWLLIEADESDGTLVKYEPEIGLLLSIDKDHKEISELMDIFTLFRSHCSQHFIVNRSHPLASSLTTQSDFDFGKGTLYEGHDFVQEGFSIQFRVAGILVSLPAIGLHSMENALACMAVAGLLGVSIQACADALAGYQGIYRRHQYYGTQNDIILVDDYAHNPAKIAASIRACLPLAPKLIAWFQPHGYGPTRFIRKELVNEIAACLRPDDEIWMSEIYYAGGTAVKDISAADLITDLNAKGCKGYYSEKRTKLFREQLPRIKGPVVILLMGARDPSLEHFAAEVWNLIAELC